MKKGFKYLIIALVILCIIIISVFSIFFLTGMFKSKEAKYSEDIAALKLEKEDWYYFFPDQLPEDAGNVTWNQIPSMLQGSGAEILSFNASTEYINSVVETYGKDARIYINCNPDGYETKEWYSIWPLTGEETEDSPGEYVEHPFDSTSPEAKGIQYITDVEYVNSSNFDDDQYNIYSLEYAFPGFSELQDAGKKNAVIYILYDNDDWNHHKIRGFYIIPEENYIYYFCQ